MAQQFVRSHIAPDKVVVFGKTGCPYCHKAVDYLEGLGLKPGHLEYVNLSGESNVEEIQQYLLQLTGARTNIPAGAALTMLAGGLRCIFG